MTRSFALMSAVSAAALAPAAAVAQTQPAPTQYAAPSYHQSAAKPDAYSAQTASQAAAQAASPQTAPVQHAPQTYTPPRGAVVRYAQPHGSAPAAGAHPAPTSAPMSAPMSQPARPAAPALRRGDGSFAVIGRLQLDANYVSADFDGLDPVSPADDVDDSSFNTGLRRGWLGVMGEAGAFGYRAEVAFENSDIKVQDAFFALKSSLGALVVGQVREPITLTYQTGNLDQTAMERAAFTSAFGFDRRLGITLRRGGSNYSAAFGVYGQNIDADPPAINLAGMSADESVSVAGRVTFAPWARDRHALHLGASARLRDAGESGGFVYAAKQGVDATDAFLFVPLSGERDTFFGLESAYVAGPFHIAGEATLLDAEFAGDTEATYTGGYLEAGWFLTGESRGYDAGSGVLLDVVPTREFGYGGLGALEARGRVDFLDLSDGTLVGGEQLAYTVGLNWYANEAVTFFSEYTYTDVDESFFGDGSVNALSVRAQLDW